VRTRRGKRVKRKKRNKESGGRADSSERELGLFRLVGVAAPTPSGRARSSEESKRENLPQQSSAPKPSLKLMRSEFEHFLFGKITYDNNTGKVTVEHPNVKERISWLMQPEQSRLFTGYYPDKFHKAMEISGLILGATDYETFGKENIPDDAAM
jgi:hypothetical protein